MIKHLHIKFFLLLFILCSQSGSLLGQTHTVSLTHPSCASCSDGKIEVSWTYGSYSVRVLLGSTTDDSVPFSFQGLTEGSYTLTYQYYGPNANGMGKSKWRDFDSEMVTLVADPYCSAKATNNDEYISRVQVGGVDKSSNWTGYADYTSLSTDVNIGVGYSITITNGKWYDGDQYGIWVDWNQDGDFNDANETIVSVSGNAVFTTTITPPANAVAGNTKMRVRVSYYVAPVACGNTTYGEVEDYTLNVVSNPVPTIASFIPDNACVGGEVVITGSNFMGATSVKFNGTAGNITSITNTQITATISNGATTGNISVTNAGGTVTSTGNFTVNTAPKLSANITKEDCGIKGKIDLTVDAGISASLDFSATSQPVDLGDNFLSGLGQFTLEGWVKFDANMSAGQHSFFGQNDVAEFGFENGALTCWTARGGNVKYSISSYPTDGEWHHVAVVGTGSGLLLYIDGQQKRTTSHTPVSNYGSSAYSVKIGAGVWDPASTNDPYEGEISVVRFWSVARSATEISDARFLKMTGSETGLLAAYRLDEATGTSLTGVGPAATTITFSNEIVWDNYASPYIYSWTKQGDGSFSATTEDINDLSAGTYDVIVSRPGCSASDSYTVGLVADVIPPTASNPAPAAVQCIGDVPAVDITVVTDEADNCTATPTVAFVSDSNNGGLGTSVSPYIVTRTYSVTDGAGNSISVTQTITAIDNEDPTITCLANITQVADAGSCDAVVTYVAPVGSDNCAGATTLQTAGLASGSAFPIGTTTNTFEVTDAAGNKASCSFDVIVNDDQDPVINNCPLDITVGACNNSVNWTAPTATDNCSVTLTSTHNSGDTFTVGTTTTVTYTATDGAGLTAACSFDVTVLPEISASITADNNPICEGETVTVTASGVGGKVPYTYEFYLNDTPIVSNANYTIIGDKLTSNLFNNNNKIKVKITDNNTCEKTSSDITITVNDLPIPNNIEHN